CIRSRYLYVPVSQRPLGSPMGSPLSLHDALPICDRGVPASWRHMNGYSSHTYSWINGEGRIFWVKYHFKTDQGDAHLTQEEADRDRKSTRLNSSHASSSYAVFRLKKKKSSRI